MSDLTSIVILSRNKAAYTRLCLQSMLQSQGAEFEVIVVDNGSTDGTLEMLEEIAADYAARGVGLRVIRNADNIGCSTARNQGAAAAAGHRIAFVDNDVAVRDAHWLLKLRQALEAASDIAIVGPKLVFPFPPYAIEFAGGAVSREGQVGYLGRGEARDDRRFNRAQDVQCLISACIMVRRQWLVDSGGFDEAFNPVQFEDIDLCYRVRSRGGRVRYEPSVEMYHFENVTTDASPDLNFKYLTVKHGLLFKQRWRHMFERERGPSSDTLRWRELPRRGIEDVGTPPLI
jgi:GT2 family glycosyltransferase